MTRSPRPPHPSLAARAPSQPVLRPPGGWSPRPSPRRQAEPGVPSAPGGWRGGGMWCLKLPSSERRGPRYPHPALISTRRFQPSGGASSLYLRALNPSYLLRAPPAPPPLPLNLPRLQITDAPPTPKCAGQTSAAFGGAGKVPKLGVSDLEARGWRTVQPGDRRRKISGSGRGQRVLDSQSPNSCLRL